MDDGAAERLLLAEPIPAGGIVELVHREEASRGFSIGRHWSRLSEPEPLPSGAQLADWLGRAVNLLCRLCAVPAQPPPIQPLLELLLGDRQTLCTFAAVLHDGFRSRASRYSFRPAEHPWDLALKVLAELPPTPAASAKQPDVRLAGAQRLRQAADRLSRQASSVGKQDRLRLLLLVALREHLLPFLFEQLLQSKWLTVYYEPGAFLRHEPSVLFLAQVLSPLSDLRMRLPAEITKGV